jgi:tRNA(Arg) A34 adenosine deaminase TadA
MPHPKLQKGDVLTERQLDDAVHAVQLHALSLGMIPIAGVMSRRVGKRSEKLHEVLGFGFNHLREGIPGIHGETAAVMNTGRIEGGYRDVIATSSLNPCPFCQRTLACHLGCAEVRILDTENYRPDLKTYKAVGLRPTLLNHKPTAATFKKWVNDPANATIWNRDIGVYDVPTVPPFDVAKNPARTKELMRVAHQKADEALMNGEAPVGALVVDPWGEILSAGHPKIATNNDPSMVAAMSAWRAAGSRDHWKDKTLFLTAGPDHIAYAMFHTFRFGQLVVASDRAFPGQLPAVRSLNVPTHLLNDRTGDKRLKSWIKLGPIDRIRETLGADFRL